MNILTLGVLNVTQLKFDKNNGNRKEMTINTKQLEVLKGDYMNHLRDNYVEEVEGETEELLAMLDIAITGFHDWLSEKGY